MSIDSGRGRCSVELPGDKKTTESPPVRILDSASQAPRPSLAVLKPSAPGEGSGQTPSHTGSRGTRGSSQVSAVSPTDDDAFDDDDLLIVLTETKTIKTHACRRAQILLFLQEQIKGIIIIVLLLLAVELAHSMFMLI
jgi:hypothetical protein